MSRLLFATFAAALVATTTAQDQQTDTLSKSFCMAYQLADGYETVIPDLKKTFRCKQRPNGYYADVDNDCKVYHRCCTDETGREHQCSYFCGENTIFDQSLTTCNHAGVSLACNKAEVEALYPTTDQFIKLSDDVNA